MKTDDITRGSGIAVDNRGANIGQQVVVHGTATFGEMAIQMPGAAGQQPSRPALPPVEGAMGEVTDRRLVDELSKVIWDPDQARIIVLAAGFRAGSIPVMKRPEGFWARIVEDARNGAVHGRVRAVADAAAQAFPANAVFRGYRGK